MKSELQIEICLFEKPLKEKEMKFSIGPTKERLLEMHKKKFTKDIYLPDWRELLLILDGENAQIETDDMRYEVTSSYQVQAYKKGYVSNITVLGITGLVLTEDNKFVFGIRGGDVGVGKADAIPGGHLSAETELNDPVFDGFYRELESELGVSRICTDDVCILGYYRDPHEIKATSFVFYSKVDFSSKELDDLHKKAHGVYLQTKMSGAQEITARKSIITSGLPNIDAWEHSRLLFIDNVPDLIQEAVHSKAIELKGRRYALRNSGFISLKMFQMFHIVNSV